MANLYVIPATDYAFYTDAQAKANETIISRIKNADYFPSLKKYANRENLPIPLVIAIVATESGGRIVGKNSAGAVGLMQMKKIAALEAIRKASINKDLTAQEKIKIAKVSPEVAKNDFKIYRARLDGVDYEVAKNQLEQGLYDSDFNLMLGTMLLGQIIDSYTDGGKVDLAKSVAIYNQGSSSRSKISGFNTATQIIEQSTLREEGKRYIKKVLGRNGYLHIQKPKLSL